MYWVRVETAGAYMLIHEEEEKGRGVETWVVSIVSACVCVCACAPARVPLTRAHHTRRPAHSRLVAHARRRCENRMKRLGKPMKHQRPRRRPEFVSRLPQHPGRLSASDRRCMNHCRHGSSSQSGPGPGRGPLSMEGPVTVGGLGMILLRCRACQWPGERRCFPL